MRLLVAGCGSIGRRHLRNLRTLGAEVRGCTLSGRESAALEAEVGAPVAGSLEEGLRWRPEAVVICSTTDRHVEVGLRALDQGCHLFVEKPIALDLPDAQRLVEAARLGRRTLAVGCNLRFHPGLRALRRWLFEGGAARPVCLRAQVGQYLPDWRPGRDYRQSYSARADQGGGMIMEGIHEIDYTLWLLGRPDSVSCAAVKLSDLEMDAEDTAALLLTFPSGSIAELHLDCVRRGYHRSCSLDGPRGSAVLDFAAGTLALDGRVETLERDFSGTYVDEMRDFLRAVEEGTASACTGEDALVALEVALAARRSSALRQTVALSQQAWEAAPAAGRAEAPV